MTLPTPFFNKGLSTGPVLCRSSAGNQSCSDFHSNSHAMLKGQSSPNNIDRQVFPGGGRGKPRTALNPAWCICRRYSKAPGTVVEFKKQKAKGSWAYKLLVLQTDPFAHRRDYHLNRVPLGICDLIPTVPELRHPLPCQMRAFGVLKSCLPSLPSN